MADFDQFSRFEALRHVIPGAFGLGLLLGAVSLSGADLPNLSAEWLAAGLLASFLLGYIFHLIGFYQNALLAKLWDRELKLRAAGKKPRKSHQPWEGHHAELALQSDGPCSWILEPPIRQAVLTKANRLAGLQLTQNDLDRREGLRWFVYHFCFNRVVKEGLGDEVRAVRSQFELIRSFQMALAFCLPLLMLGAVVFLFLRLASAPLSEELLAVASTFLFFGLMVGLILVGLLGRMLVDQQRKMSIRLAGSVYEAFIAI